VIALVLAQPEPKAKLVLAKKYKCFPSVSQDGEKESAKASVIVFTLFSFCDHTFICLKLFDPDLA